MKHLKYLLFLLIFPLIVTNCAKRGTITGGAKDTIPPKILKSIPENFSTEFNGKEIKIFFDEYIKIKDVNKQLIVSPPLKNTPSITPMGGASKTISIILNDTLAENTTYSFNFGQSIVDNNEENPFNQFKYVMSTGSHIDSLSIRGTIKDARSKKVDNYVTVMLYEAATFADSTVYKKTPRYITNTLDSLKFYELDNLKAGSYYLVALKDENRNNLYEPKLDKIGFFKDPITIPNDTLYQIELFKERQATDFKKPVQLSQNKLNFGTTTPPKGVEVEVHNNGNLLASRLTRVPEKDSLQLWIPKIKVKNDSLAIKIKKEDVVKTYALKTKEMKTADTMSVQLNVKELKFNEPYVFQVNTPVEKINKDLLQVFKADSINIPFKMDFDTFEGRGSIDFEKEENQVYVIKALPGAITDFYGSVSDSLQVKLRTKDYASYGNLTLNFTNVSRFPFMIELIDATEKVLLSSYAVSDERKTYEFMNITPNKYTVRITYDDNKDGEWTTGDFLQKKQAEEIYYFPMELDVRANWEVNQTIDLKQ
ncbi:MAG: Ig-like domain-containing protein [Flavobacterium sp.]|nr:Ig-like domain-containing protein [Candidatus Neoflavobacterium equi]